MAGIEIQEPSDSVKVPDLEVQGARKLGNHAYNVNFSGMCLNIIILCNFLKIHLFGKIWTHASKWEIVFPYVTPSPPPPPPGPHQNTTWQEGMLNLYTTYMWVALWFLGWSKEVEIKEQIEHGELVMIKLQQAKLMNEETGLKQQKWGGLWRKTDEEETQEHKKDYSLGNAGKRREEMKSRNKRKGRK